MTTEVLWAVRFIFSALVFYTIGVWSERFQGRLKPWHLVFFWLGLLADIAGTGWMARIAGGFDLNLHGVTGLVALVLMAGQTVWATVVVIRGDEQGRARFHKVAVFVWGLWMVAFATGLVLAMKK